MKNVLFITTMYPDPARKGTNVCHYFTSEWIKMGYNVKVITLRSMFPRIFTDLAALFPKLAHHYIGNDVEMDRNMNTVSHIVDSIPVWSMPIFKFRPHARYPYKSIRTTVQQIEAIICEEAFVPDAIIGHFYNPSTEVVFELKKNHPTAKSCIVFHEGPDGMLKHYGKYGASMLNSFNLVGFRHKSLRELFENKYGKLNHTFICYSGTSSVFLNSPTTHRKAFSDAPLSKFIFVGQLTYNKCIKESIEALKTVYQDKRFVFTCIGSGGTAFEELNEYVKSENLENHVLFKGQIERNKLIDYYDQNECFVMISKSEAFGLVYLEAMARGCICIGTIGQGIDGVIENGVNGFLCHGGDSNELSRIIAQINSLSAIEKQKISDNARMTAHTLSDYNVAKNYIDTVFSS